MAGCFPTPDALKQAQRLQQKQPLLGGLSQCVFGGGGGFSGEILTREDVVAGVVPASELRIAGPYVPNPRFRLISSACAP